MASLVSPARRSGLSRGLWNTHKCIASMTSDDYRIDAELSPGGDINKRSESRPEIRSSGLDPAWLVKVCPRFLHGRLCGFPDVCLCVTYLRDRDTLVPRPEMLSACETRCSSEQRVRIGPTDS